MKRIVHDNTAILTEGKFGLVDLQTVGNKRCGKEVLKLLYSQLLWKDHHSSNPLLAKHEGVLTSSISVAGRPFNKKKVRIHYRINDKELQLAVQA